MTGDVLSPADREHADRLLAVAPPLSDATKSRLELAMGDRVRQAVRDLAARQDRGAA